MTQNPITRNDTKVKLRRLKEYDGRWLDTDETLFIKGKPTKDKITDIICGMTSHSGLVIIDAEFDVSEVTLADYAKQFTA